MEVDYSFAGNLQELYQMQLASQAKPHEMLPSLFGRRIYYSETGWGSALKVVYAVLAFFLGRAFIIERMLKALEYTAIAYRIRQCQLGYHYKEYLVQQAHLLKNSGDFDEESYEKSLYSIVEWSDATRPFHKLFVQGASGKIQTLFNLYLGKEGEGLFASLSEKKEPEGYREELRMINFLRKIERPFPLYHLGRIVQKMELSDEEAAQLFAWIEAINERMEELSVEKFHTILRTFVIKAVGGKGSKEQIAEGLELLELDLMKRGLRIFEQADSEQLKWVESLKEGQNVVINNARYAVGKELVGKSSKDNRYRVFAVANLENVVILTGRNSAILGIRRRAGVKYDWALHSLLFRRISPDGRCAIVERLPEGLKGRVWQSKEKLLFEDIAYLSPLTQLIRRFISEDLTPTNLQLSHLMYSMMRELKALKPLMKGPFDLARLIHLCKECANGNRIIYNYLIVEGGIAKIAKMRRYDEFFEGVVERTIKGEEFDPADYAAICRYKITSYRIIQSAILLKGELLAMHERCMARVRGSSHCKNPIALSKEIGQAILEEYRRDRSLSSLFPEVEERVVAAFLRS